MLVHCKSMIQNTSVEYLCLSLDIAIEKDVPQNIQHQEWIVRNLFNKDLYDHNFQDYVMPQECSMRFIAEVYVQNVVVYQMR